MRVPVRLVRVLGYAIAVFTIITLLVKYSTNAKTNAPFFLFLPIWSWCGWRMISFKEKVSPFSRAEKFFCNVFEIIFMMAVVSCLIFALLAN